MVTVWRIPLVTAPEFDPTRMQLLDESERARGSGFADPVQGRRWMLAHVAMREILASTLKIPAVDVRYAREPRGRTVLDHPTDLRFSLAHAGELALVAVGNTHELGVDLERSRPVPGLSDVLRDVFTCAEQDQIAALVPDDAHRAFLRGWTRKEAIVKALGRGIEVMGQVEVTLEAKAPRLVALRVPGEQPTDWALAEIPLDPPFVGALAIRSPSVHYELRDWTIS